MKAFKKALAVVLCVTMMLTAAPLTTVISFGAGDDVAPEGYTPIYDIEDLYGVRSNLSGKYILMADIDMTEDTASGGDWDTNGYGWSPIGDSSNPFSGIFDGNNHTIIGMTIKKPHYSDSYAGLFGYVTGTILNLKISNASIKYTRSGYAGNRVYAGTLAAYIDGATIENISIIDTYVDGYETTDQFPDHFTGGMIGYANNSLIKNSYVSGTVRKNGSYNTTYYKNPTYVYNGGIVAYSISSTIQNCYNLANILGRYVYDGGIAAVSLYGKIENCINIGSAYYDICYRDNNTVRDCYFGLSAAQLKSEAAFAKLDFENTWFIDTATGVEHPQLQSNPEVDAKSITIKTLPKQQFLHHDEFDCSGLTVNVEYENGTVSERMLSCSFVSNYDMSALGTQTVTVKYLSAETTYDIIVNERPVDSIELSEQDVTMDINTTKALTVSYAPTTATNQSVTWTTDDETVATVDENGVITAKGRGYAIITATTANGIRQSCYVEVLVPVNTIALSDSLVKLQPKETHKLTAIIDPENTTDTLSWSSSDESVATVDESGLVTAIGAGNATIVATTSRSKFASCSVQVRIYSTSVELNSNVDVNVGETTALTAVMQPSNTTDTITWKSSDTSVATVSSSGVVTGKKIGTATITVTTSSGKTAICVVTVLKPSTSVKLDKTEITLNKGAEEALFPTVYPVDSTDNVTWKSSNENVATVNNGVITAIGRGKAIITVKTDSGCSATCVVNVLVPSTTVQLDKTLATVVEGATLQLTATLGPNDSTDTVVWESSAPDIAHVSDSGVVTALAYGEAVITVKTTSGKTAVCKVTVTHNIVETVTPPTCTEDGYTTNTCSVCGYSFISDETEATGHTAGDWETTVEPDCVNEGTAVKKCTVCGDELETKAIDALGHTAGDWEITVEPGCTNEGTAVKNCTVCDEKLETKPIDALGHTDGEWKITVVPTTSSEGEKTLFCSVCGESIKTEKMEMLAPICDSISWEVVDGKAVITGSDESISGDVVIPQEISEYPVTAIADGAFAGRMDITSITLPEGITTIGECAFVFCEGLTDIIIPASVTDLDETAFIGCINLEKIKLDEKNDKYSTDENGVIYNKDKTKIIYAPKKAVGDAYTMPETVEYAETSAFVDCSDFVITLSDNFYDIDLFVLDFLSVSEFRVNSTNPYFTVIDGVLYNKNATQIIKYPIDSNRELFVMPESVTDTDWYNVFCSDLLDLAEIKLLYGCADVATDMDYVRAPENLTVHIHEDFEDFDYIINGPAHICIDFMSDAEFAELKSAIDDFKSECVQEFEEIKQEVSETYGKDSAEYAVVEKLSDDYMDAFAGFVDCGSDHSRLHPTAEIEEKLDATCTEDGYIRYYCEDCGYKFEVVLEATGHNHKTTVTAPTCEDKGYTTYTCSCGDSYVDNYVDALGHSYTTVVTAPTCEDKGYTTYTCECGDSYVDDCVDATGHSHTSEVTTPATHTTTGVMTYTCHCGDTYTETIDKIADHNYNAVVIAPTCEDKGYTTYTCVCGDSYVADYVDAKGHTAGEWVVIKPATSTQSGTKTQSCTVCGTVLNTQTIPAYGKVNSVSVSNVSLDYKSSTTLNPQISIDVGVKYTVSYSSSNPSVASVDANGKITTKDTGSATITVTVTDEYGNTVSDTCNVEVKYKWWQWILVIVLFGWIWY